MKFKFSKSKFENRFSKNEIDSEIRDDQKYSKTDLKIPNRFWKDDLQKCLEEKYES